MMKKDYYEVLGVPKTADASVIKKAYRKLAKKYHPDSNEGNARAAENFKEVNEAYAVLGDEKKRKLYDQYGMAAFDETAGGYGGAQGFGGNSGFGGFNGAQGYGSAGGNGGFGGFRNGTFRSYGGTDGGFHEYHFENGEDMDDILKNIFGGSGFYGGTQGFGGFKNAQGYGSAGGNGSAQGFDRSGFGKSGFGQGGFDDNGFRRKGSDVRSNMEIGFDEAAFGSKKRLHIQSADGKQQSLEVNIPAGIADGKTIRLKGKGNPGVNGGEAGDLLLKVKVHDKPGFRREGQNVYTTVTVPFTVAALGGEVKIKTIYGDVLCKVKEGTQSGSQIRLKGKGIVAMGNPSVHGDQYVTVEVQVPKHLTPQARQKLREFGECCGACA